MKKYTVLGLLLSIFFVACGMGEKSLNVKKHNQSVDYSKKENWLKFQKNTNKECDVFFVHPTTYLDTKEGMNASIENAENTEFTAVVVDKLVGAFENTCNAYAPKYKQASIKVLSLSVQERKKYIDFARKDVEDAFKYFLKNINKGRPYIIAGHSQGSNIIKDMLVENPNLAPKNNLVAVYAIGYTITQKDLDKMGLPLAVTPTQTSGMITWNTIGKGGKSPTIEANALCVNPLDWTNSKKNQDSSKNIFADINGVKIPHFTSAQIDKNGALVIPTPKIIDKLPMLMGKEVYHMYDYDFFYGNLIENVKKRCNAWKEKQKGLNMKRGKLISSKLVASISKNKINEYFPERKNMKGNIDDLPKYDIDLYKITYNSIYQDKIVELSGLIVVPKKKGIYTHVQYHHGTLLPYWAKDGWGNMDAPSLYKGAAPKTHKEQYETRLYGNYLGSYGYFVSLPDYAGYGVSTNLEHPYSINTILAKQSVDMILASREFAKNKGLLLEENIALTGWSEGGAVSVATQKLIEEKYQDKIKLLANASISAFLNVAQNFSQILLASPKVDIDLGENMDFLAWTYYAYNKFSNKSISFDSIFKIPVKKDLDVLKDRPTNIPSKVFKLLDKTSYNHLLEVAKKNDLAHGFKPVAPLFIHHGNADKTVTYENNPEVALKNYKNKKGNASLIKYEGHNHDSLGLIQLRNMISKFEEIKINKFLLLT